METHTNNDRELLQKKYELDSEYYKLIYRLVAVRCCVPDGLQAMLDDFVDIEIELIEKKIPISQDHIHNMTMLVEEIADQVTLLEEGRYGKRL